MRISPAGSEESGKASTSEASSAGSHSARRRTARSEIRAASAGFSLIEVVMVVLVIGLTLAISYPALSRGGTALRLRASGRDLMNLLRYAREKAITEQQGMMVTADRDARRVVLSDELGGGAHVLALPKDVRIERCLLAGTEVRQGPMIIRFLPNGSSDSSEIMLVADTGAALRVITDPITGGARIQLAGGEASP